MASEGVSLLLPLNLESGDEVVAAPTAKAAPPFRSAVARALTSQWLADARHFLTTIAVLLGIGILGLPLQLVDCGFAPFVVTLSVTLLMQIAVVVIATDLLQRAHAHLAAGGGGSADLHTMGNLYLPAPVARAFDLSVVVVFVSTLISYGLAGSGAFGSLLGVPAVDVITPFVLACAGLVIFFEQLVQPLVSSLTFFKVSVLVVIIALCGVVARQTGLHPHESYASLMQPFLVGTVAIGGIADLMPVMMDERARATAQGLRHFRASLCAGVVACWLLNLLWAYFVLAIVPQRRNDALADGVSLEAAAAKGEIATIPVTEVIAHRFAGEFGWLAQAITVFIVLSICVSFNAIGLGFKHVLSGMAASICERFGLPVGSGGDVTAGTASDLRSLLATRAVFYALYVGGFGAVLVVAIMNPQGFLLVLGAVTSMALNLAGGVFVALMYVASRQRAFDEAHPLLLPLDEGMGSALAAFVLASFDVAVLYDVHGSTASPLGEAAAAWSTGVVAAVLVAVQAAILLPSLLRAR